MTCGNPVISCGCRIKEVQLSGFNTKHNKTNTSIYNRWLGMKGRCNNPNNKKYKNYGGRGIKICDDWNNNENGFKNFYEWAIRNNYKNNLTLDRIDVNGDYEPKNCRWVDMIVQENNRTNNRIVNYEGKEYTLFELSQISKVCYKTLHQRIYKYKWDVDKAVNMPSRIKNKKGVKILC